VDLLYNKWGKFSNMQVQLIGHFPHRTHPLTLVSGQNGLLADETFLATLNRVP
jgi:hypothetical protein